MSIGCLVAFAGAGAAARGGDQSRTTPRSATGRVAEFSNPISIDSAIDCQRLANPTGQRRPAPLVEDYLLKFRTSGNGSKSLPLKTCSNSVSNALWTKPLEASVSRLSSKNGPPLKSVTIPPASCTISTPAAVSQEFKLNSQKPSRRPQAT